MDKQEPQWDNLREDLKLLPAPAHNSGAPCWTLHDSKAGKFFKIGWLEFEILKRWHFANPNAILQDIALHTTLKPTLDDVIALYQFLKSSFLLNTHGNDDTKAMMALHDAKTKGNTLTRLLKNYLFFRIPLVKPDDFLDKLMPYVRFLMHKSFLVFVLCAAVMGAFLVFRDFGDFLSGFSSLNSPAGILSVFITLSFAKIIHEMGHAIVSKHYNCRVPQMGVAFIVMWPLLWTDTTDAWRLTDKNKRLMIDGGGMMAELMLAAFASILWALSPEGAFKDAMHVLAGVTWVMTVFVNLNPFMRFDGYYLLSDYLDIPNLQDRAFGLTKNVIRKKLWGISAPKKDYFSPKLELGLIAYSIGTWIYRFFLFIGIALIVYHFFFKALGVFLMIVEIWWFIMRPITNEIGYWIKNRSDMSISLRKKVVFLSIIALFAFLLFFPWRGQVSGAAMLKSTQEIPLFTSSPARIETINVAQGERVTKGDLLYTLNNPDIKYNVQLAQIEQQILTKDLNNKAADGRFIQETSLLRDELLRQQSQVALEQSKLEALSIKAPIDGVIVDIPDGVKQGTLLPKKEFLGLIRSYDFQIEAFVTERHIDRLSVGAPAQFWINKGSNMPINASITAIEPSATKNIPYPELSAEYGGDIAVSMNEGAEKPTPKERHYKVVLTPDNKADYSRNHTGRVIIDVPKQSIATQWYRKIVSILIQESSIY